MNEDVVPPIEIGLSVRLVTYNHSLYCIGCPTPADPGSKLKATKAIETTLPGDDKPTFYAVCSLRCYGRLVSNAVIRFPQCARLGCDSDASETLSEEAALQFCLPPGSVICGACFMGEGHGAEVQLD